MTSFNLRIALLGLVTLTAALSLPACASKQCCNKDGRCAEQCNETKIEMKDLPPAVKAALDKESAGGKVTELEKCMMKGKTFYSADVEMGGKSWDICIAEDGTLQSKKLETKDEMSEKKKN